MYVQVDVAVEASQQIYLQRQIHRCTGIVSADQITMEGGIFSVVMWMILGFTRQF